jgi:chemotaxis protein MotB
MPDVWPGWVDALSTLLIVALFLLMVFALAQYFLTEVLSGRNEALARLNRQVAELADMLSLEKRNSAELRRELAQLSDELQSSTAARDALSAQIEALTQRANSAEGAKKTATEAMSRLSEENKSLQARASAAEQSAAALGAKLKESEEALGKERSISASAQQQVALLNQQIAALREQLARIAAALDASEKKAKEQQIQIVNLGQRLNAALATKVEELARYRSEFFGKLRQVLGGRQDIRIVGDRFVFQSEVLFPTASADLTDSGKAKIASIADVLKTISKQIPKDINWVLQVDGHTDRRPIHTAQFPSNWELSTARATSVVKQLIDLGIPPDRLAAAGYGEYQPIDNRDDEIGWRRNRRIEFKLTNR